MKLRNKKTGAIYKIEDIDLENDADGIWLGMTKYNSLAELNADWEDAPEEPKEHWYIDLSCNDIKIYEDLCVPEEVVKKLKQIGNYFETKEEAEKAVEKLKAWQRLKDKGFRFFNNKIIGEYGNVSYRLHYPANTIEEKDLDLLFSGGEE